MIPAAATPPLRLAVLISGTGTTLRNLLERIAAGRLPARIVLVISSNARAGGLNFALQAGVPSEVIEHDSAGTPEEFSRAIFDRCRAERVEYVAMAGFLKYVPIPPDFENRVVNIHPALIPAFCGEGFYGLRVHQAALEYGVKFSGCTVHFVDNRYDHGPIILQKIVPVEAGDTAETLAARVFEAECDAYPEALTLLAERRVTVSGREVRIQPGQSAAP